MIHFYIETIFFKNQRCCNMHLLYISNNSLSFGCVKATDLAGHCVTILLHENRFKHTNYSPNVGDFLLCEAYHDSVYRPLALICESHLFLRKLDIPLDILQEYFPLCKNIRRFWFTHFLWIANLVLGIFFQKYDLAFVICLYLWAMRM